MFLDSVLTGGVVGGALRIVPEAFKFFNDKAVRKHELDMTRVQLEIDQHRSEQHLAEMGAQADIAADQADAEAYITALKGQSQLTGNKLIDGLNASVRPILMYWWQLLFTVSKVSFVVYAWMEFTNWQTFGQAIWTDKDWGVFSMMLNFFFVGRVFSHHQKK